MYMCSYCKQTGEWAQLSGCLSLSKTKQAKISELFKDQTNSLMQAMDEVKQSTHELRLLTEEDVHSILEKFKLPVSPFSIVSQQQI